MHPIFSVSSKDIQRLTDVQARELVARLCKSELRALGISPAGVSWGGDQRAKDGGVDVRVDVSLPHAAGGYIKKDTCVFQVKAEAFSAPKIKREMAPKGILRPAIKELARRGGAYVIASTRDDFSDTSGADRKNAMESCLSEFGMAGKVELDFFDSRRIADWVEQYPAVVTWVKDACGSPLIGWKPYGPWAYQEYDVDAEYIIDDRVRVFVPNADRGLDVSTAIRRLRTDLSKNVSVRMVGLSGVGKTRLVQALFDDRLYPDQPPLDPENVIYADLSDSVIPQPSVMVDALVASRADCVVVVDNCGPDVHQRLTEIAKRSGSRIRLITVEYDIRDDLPEGTVCYRLEGSADNTIKELLRRKHTFLSEVDIETIAEFSDGNARVAFALASTTEMTGELARLRDSELFRRLFYQKHVASDELLKCAESASLLYSFDGEDMSPKGEMGILAGLCEVSLATFVRNVVELQRRGLVQQRGRWRAVLPHAIANRLAASAIEVFPAEVLNDNLIDNASDRVARSFSRRIGYLHDSRKAAEIVSAWLKPHARLGDLTKLNDLERAIFSNVAPVDEEVALAAMELAVEDVGFTSIDNLSRNQFTRVARLIAYDPRFFDRAVKVLVRFAVQEPMDYDKDSARDVLKSLFYCFLSGTEARSTQRAKSARKLLFSADDRERKLGFVLLGAALEASHFTSSYGFEFGARKRGFGWSPQTQQDVLDWYAPFVDLAVEIGCTESSQGAEARLVLGESLRGLWVKAGLIDEITSAAKALKATDGWPEGWLGVRRVLHWDKAALSKGSLSQLLELERELAPSDLRARIRAMVIARGSFADDVDLTESDNGGEANIVSRFRTSEIAAESLGKQAAHDESLLVELLPDLLRAGINGKASSFGFGIGLESANVSTLICSARTLICNAVSGSIRLTFIHGLLTGWRKMKLGEAEAFLDQALHDEVWGRWFPELQLCVGLDESGYKRLLKSLELGRSPIWQYRYLGAGRVTDALSINQILSLVGAISKSQNGLPVAIEVFGMVVHCAFNKSPDYRAELGRSALSFLRDLDWSDFQTGNVSVDDCIDEILEIALSTTDNEGAKLEVLRNVVAFERSQRRSFSYERGRLLAPFFKHFPKETLDQVYVPDDDGTYRRAVRIVCGSDSDSLGKASEKFSADTLIEWCNVSPTDRYVFAAEICRLFDKHYNEAELLSISDVSVRILAAAHDKAKILRIFIDRFRPRSWSGPLSVVLRKRLPLFDALNPAGDLVMRTIVEETKREFAEWISAEEKAEEDEEKVRNEKFE